ncbi:MAG: hypothetical protein ACX94C_13220 [Phycisphaerales bacterium]
MGEHGWRRRRRGLAWRLTFVVFAVMLLMLAFSFVASPQIRAEYYPFGQARGDAYYTLRLSLGRLSAERLVYGSPPGSAAEIEVVLDRMGRGWVAEMYMVRAPFSYDRVWWALPGHAAGRTSRGAYAAYSMPLVYPVAVMGAVLLIPVIRGRASKKRGGCTRCGYSLDGIESGVCPECGVERG